MKAVSNRIATLMAFATILPVFLYNINGLWVKILAAKSNQFVDQYALRDTESNSFPNGGYIGISP